MNTAGTDIEIVGAADDSDSCEEMSAFLDAIHNRRSTNLSQEPDTITQTLTDFIGTTVNVKKPILEYWEENKFRNPILYKLSQIIYAVPPTQTTVERSFSALPLILTSLRTNISDTNLNNILLIRSNSRLLKELNSKDGDIVFT